MALRGKKGLIGLDIGSSSIKVAELKETKKGYLLENFGMVPLPPEAIVDGALMNSPAIVEAIQSLIGERKIKTKDVAISVSGASVMIRKISLPVMTEEELDDQIQWEAEQYIPFNLSDVNLAYEVLNRGNDEGNMDLLLVAAKKDMINDYVAVITEAGLNPVIVDLDAFSVLNAYEINYQIMENEVLAIVNMGASIINMVITKGGKYLFSRDVTVGGNLYTEEIMKELSVSWEEAELLKLGGAATGETEAVMRQEVEAVIRRVSDQIASEIAKSLDFYQATAAEEQISKVWLAGGACGISGMAEAIQQKQNVPVEIMDPFRNLERNPKLFDPAYLEQVGARASVSIGLALRRVGDR
ncbi:MAG TPA: type IV pilus assembly protein PilM [bacterium]|nr:type IV pilus assembly protein PilM [bacterium]